jgi:hypothetical protein
MFGDTAQFIKNLAVSLRIETGPNTRDAYILRKAFGPNGNPDKETFGPFLKRLCQETVEAPGFGERLLKRSPDGLVGDISGLSRIDGLRFPENGSTACLPTVKAFGQQLEITRLEDCAVISPVVLDGRRHVRCRETSEALDRICSSERYVEFSIRRFYGYVCISDLSPVFELLEADGLTWQDEYVVAERTLETFAKTIPSVRWIHQETGRIAKELEACRVRIAHYAKPGELEPPVVGHFGDGLEILARPEKIDDGEAYSNARLTLSLVVRMKAPPTRSSAK